MVNKVIKLKLFVVLAFVSALSSLHAQYSLGGGLSTIFQFGNNKPFVGGHFVVEVPQNDEVTFYGRISYTLPQKYSYISPYLAYDPVTFETEQFSILTNSKMNILSIDGGTRYYVINGYDESISLYGGTNVGLTVSSVKRTAESIDGRDLRSTVVSSDYDYFFRDAKGTLLSVSLGITGGLKYTMPGRGTIFFDINPSLHLFTIPSNNDPSYIISYNYNDAYMTGIQPTPSDLPQYKQLLFNFGIGYRKEFY